MSEPQDKGKPSADRQAMEEAISASKTTCDSFFSSAASYAHFLKSQLAQNKGDYRRAVNELRLALASSPESPFLLTALAEKWARLGDPGQAERELRKVVEASPNYFKSQLLLGRVLLEQKKYARARTHLRKAIQLSPTAIEPHLALAQISLSQGDLDGATATIEEMAARIPGEPSGFRKLGTVFAERGENRRAEVLLNKAVSRDPNDFETWFELAQVYENLGKLGAAENAYTRALELEPESREANLAAARLAMQTGHVAKGREYFEKLLYITHDSELAVKIAFSLLATGRAQEAAALLDSARSLGLSEPRLAFYSGLVHEQLRHFSEAAQAFESIRTEAGEVFHEARWHRAECLSRLGQHPLALELFRQSMKEKPDHVAGLASFAKALERAGQFQEAEHVLVQSIQRAPSAEAFEALADLLEQQGRLSAALELLTRSLKNRPRDEALLFTLGAMYERKGDSLESIRVMREVLEVNPEHVRAMNFIAYSLANQGRDFDEAEKLLQRALELRPNTGSFLDSLGWVYFRSGNFKEAVKVLEKAAELLPGAVTVNEHLGDAYSKIFLWSKAHNAYERALQSLKDDPESAEHPKQKGNIEMKIKNLSIGSNGR